MKKQTKKQQSGRSMIEMVGVLAVMGLITAAAFILINSAMSSQRLSRVDDDVSGIVNGVRLLYNGSADFSGVENGTPAGNDTLILLGFGKAGTGNEYQNPYGGNYVLASQNGATRTFTVTITKLGEKTCTVLKNRKWPAGGVASATCAAGSDNSVVVTYGKADTSVNP